MCTLCSFWYINYIVILIITGEIAIYTFCSINYETAINFCSNVNHDYFTVPGNSNAIFVMSESPSIYHQLGTDRT